MTLTVASIDIADPAAAWARAGFTVDDGVCHVGGVRIRLGAAGTGITGWVLRGVPERVTDLDGIPTSPSDAPPSQPAAHANGVVSIDHVVLLSPNLTRTVGALAELGEAPRRERDGELGGQPIRQIFFRFGEVIIEVVGAPDAVGDGPSSLWASRTWSTTSTPPQHFSVTTRCRSKMPYSPAAGSPRYVATGSG